ncbi:hypothetical protein NHP190003_12840 [Helicobacter sp. NHP19-003]|uniref:Phage-Barnase-EndoU-ColicinE5/D-RelE like nuclease 3 domain-containing protein n=1 Tax=Helicobacter gastrocanis TaxID=2849641 RepID=A0ABN6I337_9HELI|nr:hypothetical protein NHP190003_12840 [Helicobacter sp. NHP19-003]
MSLATQGATLAGKVVETPHPQWGKAITGIRNRLMRTIQLVGVRGRRWRKGGSGGDRPPTDSGDLFDPNQPPRKVTKEEITPEFLEEVKKRKNEKVWVGELTNPKIIGQLGFKTDKPVKMLFDGDALRHIEERHGVDSKLAKNGQPPITSADIATYPDIVNHAT